MYPNPDAYYKASARMNGTSPLGRASLLPDKADSTAGPLGHQPCLCRRAGKQFPDIASVDKAGVKIGTIRGAPSDRVLTREIKAAEIVRIPLSPTITADAAEPAALRQGGRLWRGLRRWVSCRRKPCRAPRSCRAPLGRFAWRRRCQKVAPHGAGSLATFVDEAKQTGVVQKAIDAKGLKGVNVASK